MFDSVVLTLVCWGGFGFIFKWLWRTQLSWFSVEVVVEDTVVMVFLSFTMYRGGYSQLVSQYLWQHHVGDGCDS